MRKIFTPVDMVGWIEVFEQECEENQYVESGEVMDLLHDLKKGLQRLAARETT